MVLSCIFCRNDLHLFFFFLLCVSSPRSSCPVLSPFSVVPFVDLPSFVLICSLYLHSLFSFSSLLLLSCLLLSFFLFLPSPFLPSLFHLLLCPLLRPVRYRRQLFSAWLPLKNCPWPNPAPCHTGTSSKPVSRGRWSCLCHSNTCSSACPPGPRAPLHRGAYQLPSGLTSPGRVCRCPGIQTLWVA